MTAKGDEYRGSFDQTKRVGIFKVIDFEGTLWTEKYDSDGKRIARNKDKIKRPNPAYDSANPSSENPEFNIELKPKLAAAQKCWNCNYMGRFENNHIVILKAFSCN